MPGSDGGTPGGQVRPPGKREIDRLESPCRPEQEGDGALTVARDHGEVAAQKVCLRAAERAEFPGLRFSDGFKGRAERACLVAQLRGGQCASGPPRRLLARAPVPCTGAAWADAGGVTTAPPAILVFSSCPAS